jgi:hypothetical protein
VAAPGAGAAASSAGGISYYSDQRSPWQDQRRSDEQRSPSRWRPTATPAVSPKQTFERHGAAGQHRAGRKRATHAKGARLAANEADRAEARAKEARSLATEAAIFAKQQQDLSERGRQRVRYRVKKEKNNDQVLSIEHSPGHSSENSGEEADGDHHEEKEGEEDKAGDGDGDGDGEDDGPLGGVFDPDDPSMVYDGHDTHWVEKSKEMAGLLRYGKHRGRCLSLQQSGWSSQDDLASCMQIPSWVVMSIAVGSMDYKGNPRFITRSEDSIVYIRPYFYQGSRARNSSQQQHSW